MYVHIKVEGTQLRELLLVGAENLVDDRPLAVDNFVVGQRQQMALIVIIVHGECQELGALGTLVRSLHEIIQCVIHPAQIPLIIKSQASLFRGLCTAGIRGAVLCDQHGSRMQCVDAGIHFFQKSDRCFIHTAKLIAHPVDDPADRIHAQSVEMIFGEPVVGCGLHEACHLTAGKDEVAAAPLAV